MRARFWLAAIALAALLLWGLNEIVRSPLESGDVYPPYSSLRSDPLGARALYESLAELPELQVSRLYKSREVLADRDAAIFVLGVDPNGWLSVAAKTLEQYEKLVSAGGRLVIGFLPVRVHVPPTGALAVEQRWHLRLRAVGSRVSPVLQRDPGFGFVTGPEWTVLESNGRYATALERNFGAGSIVLLTSCFPLSNEGLSSARKPDLIARIVGAARRVWFDEEHFGVAESGSVATLLRKYRLEGGVAVLLLTTLLFLWRSTSSFLPPASRAKSEMVTGRDSMDAMASLLRRGIPRKNLIAACREEWRKSAAREPRAERVDDELQRLESGGPLEAYRSARRILTTETK
jgi:hypothetical protein